MINEGGFVCVKTPLAVVAHWVKNVTGDWMSVGPGLQRQASQELKNWEESEDNGLGGEWHGLTQHKWAGSTVLSCVWMRGEPETPDEQY